MAYSATSGWGRRGLTLLSTTVLLVSSAQTSATLEGGVPVSVLAQTVSTLLSLW